MDISEKTVVHKPIKFWQIIKPYMTVKIQANDHKDLMHDNEINDDRLSCFQDDIIKRVAANSSEVNVSNFSSGTVKGINNLLTIWVGKGTGHDNIPPKILAIAADELAFPITNQSTL